MQRETRLFEPVLRDGAARQQKTLRNPIGCVGTGLHTGAKVSLTLRPAAPDSGVRFVRYDRPGGSAIIATFAPDGPEKCSGLPCVRYSPDSLLRELGEGVRLDEWVRESHQTPFETVQEFGYQRFTRVR